MLSEPLKPKQKAHVFDLVSEAGYDTADWINSSNDPRGHKANPKYCYEWSFVEPTKFVILNLWHANMREADGTVYQLNNFREDAKANIGKSAWVRRATSLDRAIQTAFRESLPVRVIINDGVMRSKNDPHSPPSKVTARELDPIPWTVSKYDWVTGENVLIRGVAEVRYVDQFELQQGNKVALGRQELHGTSFIRNPAVRRAALARAKGSCELCGVAGFEMASGAVYLETHHMIPLSEGGLDDVSNVVAICPNDHARAHYAADKDDIRQQLERIVRGFS